MFVLESTVFGEDTVKKFKTFDAAFNAMKNSFKKVGKNARKIYEEKFSVQQFKIRVRKESEKLKITNGVEIWWRKITQRIQYDNKFYYSVV